MALLKQTLIYWPVFIILLSRAERADQILHPSPAIHRPQSEPLTEGWHTSLGEVFLWVFPTQSIVTRDFTEQLNHESKMVWKWGTSEEEREDRESVGNSLTRGGDGREMANSHVEQWMMMMMMTASYEKKHMYQQPILFLHINSY